MLLLLKKYDESIKSVAALCLKLFINEKYGENNLGAIRNHVRITKKLGEYIKMATGNKPQKSRRKISLPWFRQGSVSAPHHSLTRQHTIDTPGGFHARFMHRQTSQVEVRSCKRFNFKSNFVLYINVLCVTIFILFSNGVPEMILKVAQVEILDIVLGIFRRLQCYSLSSVLVVRVFESNCIG